MRGHPLNSKTCLQGTMKTGFTVVEFSPTTFPGFPCVFSSVRILHYSGGWNGGPQVSDLFGGKISDLWSRDMIFQVSALWFYWVKSLPLPPPIIHTSRRSTSNVWTLFSAAFPSALTRPMYCRCTRKLPTIYTSALLWFLVNGNPGTGRASVIVKINFPLYDNVWRSKTNKLLD